MIVFVLEIEVAQFMPLDRLAVTDLAPQMESKIVLGRDVCIWDFILISSLTSFSDSGHWNSSLRPYKMKP